MKQISNNNILVVNKPTGWTSNDMVQKVKHILHAKKVGHAGTLDPLATGVLVLGINEGTKQLGHLIMDDKRYFATINFGYETETYDLEGKVTAEKPFNYSNHELLAALDSFMEEPYHQMPPKYSAIKVNGKKLYEYARKNQPVEIKPRLVKINNITIVHVRTGRVDLVLDVSKGFYVRSFAHDLAAKLNTYGTITEIVRLKSGPYTIYDAKELDDIYDSQH